MKPLIYSALYRDRSAFAALSGAIGLRDICRMAKAYQCPDGFVSACRKLMRDDAKRAIAAGRVSIAGEVKAAEVRDMNSDLIITGSFVTSRRDNPRAAFFRVDRVARNGWLTCTLVAYSDGMRAGGGFGFKFRISEMKRVAALPEVPR